MATTKQLVDSGRLVKVEGNLLPHQLPQRCIYALPRAIRWMNNDLPTIRTDGVVEGALEPLEQADALINDFLSGIPPDMWVMAPHLMHPHENGVWELRTPDLRFFGWFWRRGIFILSAIGTAEMCKQRNLYHGYQTQCLHDMRALDLDPPCFTDGGIEDVF